MVRPTWSSVYDRRRRRPLCCCDSNHDEGHRIFPSKHKRPYPSGIEERRGATPRQCYNRLECGRRRHRRRSRPCLGGSQRAGSRRRCSRRLQHSRSQLSRDRDWSVLGRSDTCAHAPITDNEPQTPSSLSNAASTPAATQLPTGNATQSPAASLPRGWIGVRIQSVTDEISERLNIKPSRGVLVVGVDENGPQQVEIFLFLNRGG